jgi:hypothetical protein
MTETGWLADCLLSGAEGAKRDSDLVAKHRHQAALEAWRWTAQLIVKGGAKGGLGTRKL